MPPKKESNSNSSSGSGKLTKEEERLLLESSRQVTRTTSALFYGNAFIVSALPLCKRKIIDKTLYRTQSFGYCVWYCNVIHLYGYKCVRIKLFKLIVCRAVLACSDDGSCDILHCVCCPDHPQHLASGLRIQEHQSQSEAQVRKIINATTCVSSHIKI